MQLLELQVQVKRRGDEQKFIAEVLAIGTECDIALLTVHDDAFWEGVDPLELGSLPRLQVGGNYLLAPSLGGSNSLQQHRLSCVRLDISSGSE